MFTSINQSKKNASSLSLLGILLFSCLTIVQVSNAQSVLLNGSTQHMSVGNAAALHLTDFTLEAWIKIEGNGAITSTGAGGYANIVPIIAKGRAESESAVVDVNYFLGYDLTSRKLQADFEDNATSLNHPVQSNTGIGTCWTHVAASYNTSTNTWKLYINGALDQTLALGSSFIPQSLSNVTAAIGTSINSTGVTEGFFNGKIDEVRIWNTVRTDAEITSNYNAELASGTGLMSRWGFNEGTGTSAANSIAGQTAASLINNPIWSSGFNQPSAVGSSLDFSSANSDKISFGAAPGLNSSSFTLEAWIKIEGAGITTVTSGAGGGGFEGTTAAVPIVTKGRGEADVPENVNMNYFMGLVGNKLAADFEEGGTAPANPTAGVNHSVIGLTTIPTNTWTHVAATYEPVTAVWNLYINGVLDKTVDIGTNIIPVANSIQYAGVGTAMTSTGLAAGYFDGKIDEVRIWNTARSGAQILANYNSEITSGTGLLGRWGFNEGCGGIANNSVSGGVSGTLSSATGPVWVTGNFNSQAPNQPTNPSPATAGFAANTSPTLCATVSDPNGGNLQVKFYGRRKIATGAKFTVIGLPDTQFYTEEVQGTNSAGGGHNGIFKAQTQWIADHRVDSNVAFVVQLGDCVQNGDTPPGADPQIEWKRADTSMQNIENPNVPITYGIPYGICVGNHDQGTIGNPDGPSVYYNQYFGSARFNGRTYYGGHYGSNNDNHYELFSAGGIDFIHISLEYYPDGTTASLQAVLDWADALLKANSNRKGILSTHNLIGTGNPASFQGPGQKIYDDLKDNPNLILMLAGHVPGEGRRSDVFNGNTIYSLMSDYQSGYSNGGNGYLRIMQFLPAQNLLSVKTYSPYSNTSFTSATSEFTLPVSLSPAFTLIGTNTTVASGSSTCMNWLGLQQSTEYEWYAEVTDGESTITGPVWTFTTPASGPLPVNFIHFTARAENNNKVKLNFSTSNEKDNLQFIVQRADDGNHFTNLGSIPGTNNAGTVQQYSFYDNQPLKGNSFYRIKQIDIDGEITYSTIERVNISSSKQAIEIYPNPANGNAFNIKLPAINTGNIEISIYDISGRLQMNKMYNSNGFITVDHSLAAGIYSIKIAGKDFTEIKKLIIE